MSNNCNDIAKILLTDGTNQIQRNDNALDPESLKIHGFGMEEWMKFAHNFAGHLNYYSSDSATTPQGDWQDFFLEDDAIQDLIDSLKTADNLTPHLTLFVCFLKLLELPNDSLNALTKRHLDYYYKEVLQIEQLPATYDKVHLLFELSKAFSSNLYEEGLQFNGGKDAIGKLRVYELIEEFAANKATIGSLRNFYMAPENNPEINSPYMKSALNVQTLDGLEEALSEDQSEWYAFGYDKSDSGLTTSDFLELPDAKVGFAIASDTLKMAEGERHFQISLQFDQDISGITSSDLMDNISVYCTNEKRWIQISEESAIPSDLLEDSDDADIPFYTGIKSGNPKIVQLYSLIDIDAPVISGYDAEIHGENFNTTKPVFRFIIDTSNSRGYKVFKEFSKRLSKISIEIQVAQMRGITLENDLGTLNPSKPMYPFSNTPISGSNFTMTSDEIFSKNWQEIDMYVSWTNVPLKIAEHYANYGISFHLGAEPIFFSLWGGRGRWRPQRQYGDIFPPIADVLGDTVNYEKYQHFWAKRGLKINGAWINSTQAALFTSRSPVSGGTEASYFTEAQFRRGSLKRYDTVEQLRIQLYDSFYHAEYPQLYTLSLLQDEIDTTKIPEKPYTPLANEVQVSYKATDEISLSASADVYENAETILFHEHPFGQTEEHTSIKTALGFVENTTCSLVPAYTPGGELYIGLENALPLQNIPLLFQVSEGTENTEVDSFTGDEAITWEVLCSNHWKPLENSEILKNEVDNFLKSGIVTLTMPKELTSDNTLLPSGYQWIRARMDNKPYDTVCKFIGIHSQVAVAQFTDNDNDTSHLETGLEAETISKLIQRSSTVKSILQPYNSFGGSPAEEDESYYRRVSERLRHKNRAVTIWDYENMVLQQFPDIYRVKCLSHSTLKSFNAGGGVIVVVIPDTVNKNVFNIYEPRVSTAYLNEIHDFLSKHNSMHVCLKVMNPEYEAIHIKTSVHFNEGYDQLLYESILEEDITKLLAPWAYDETKEIEFGGKLHKSMLINYIENLEYVDFIQSIRIYIERKSSGSITRQEVQNYEATSPLTIMVSSLSHEVTAVDEPCETRTDLRTPVDCE